jgi:hypothetical protein
VNVQTFLCALVVQGRRQLGDGAARYLSARVAAWDCGWTSESMLAALALTGVSWGDVERAALGLMSLPELYLGARREAGLEERLRATLRPRGGATP